MTDMKVPFVPGEKTSPTNSGEEKRFPFILLGAADLIRAAALLVGAGFFTLILLIGMGIAMHLSTLSGAWMVMGFTLLMSVLISLLTYHTTAKVHHFKEKILEQTLPSSADLLSLQAQMQKLLEILLALQKELPMKEKNSHTDDHSSGN